MIHVLDREANRGDGSLDVLRAKLKDAKNNKRKLKWDNFSFDKARTLLKNVKENLSDMAMEERNEKR